MPIAAAQPETSLVDVGPLRLPGRLCMPRQARGIVLCIDESGSSLSDARHRSVVGELTRAAVATLRIDLLTSDEHASATLAGHQPNDIQLLAERVVSATDWLGRQGPTGCLPIGYFGTGIGSAIALTAAAERPAAVSAVVSSNGRPLLVRAALPQVRAPTLLIAVGSDAALARVNRAGFSQMFCEKRLEIVRTVRADEGEPLKDVYRLARAWFQWYLVPPPDDAG